MDRLRLSSALRMSFSHHPYCFPFQKHVVTIKGIKLCLGCMGLYSGIIIGIVAILILNMQVLEWQILVIVSFCGFLPLLLRLMKIPYFTTTTRFWKFMFRLFLGIAIIIGILSILKAPNIYIAIIQFFIGVGVAIAIFFERWTSLDAMFLVCNECSFERSHCPGMHPALYKTYFKSKI